MARKYEGICRSHMFLSLGECSWTESPFSFKIRIFKLSQLSQVIKHLIFLLLFHLVKHYYHLMIEMFYVSFRLAIHLQHLTNCPIMFQNKVHDTTIWQGSEDIADHEQFLEAINGKKFSHICTMPIKYNPKWNSKKDVAFIVTGAQLLMKKQDSKNVLHLRLLFSRVSDCYVTQSKWAECSSEFSQKSGLFSAITMSISGTNQAVKEKQPAVIVDSGVFPTGPPVSQHTQKLLKFVDTSHLCKGPQDNPGHWLVTGARLVLEKGKIGLHVKFSLLNICS